MNCCSLYTMVVVLLVAMSMGYIYIYRCRMDSMVCPFAYGWDETKYICLSYTEQSVWRNDNTRTSMMWIFHVTNMTDMGFYLACWFSHIPICCYWRSKDNFAHVQCTSQAQGVLYYYYPMKHTHSELTEITLATESLNTSSTSQLCWSHEKAISVVLICSCKTRQLSSYSQHLVHLSVLTVS